MPYLQHGQTCHCQGHIANIALVLSIELRTSRGTVHWSPYPPGTGCTCRIGSDVNATGRNCWRTSVQTSSNAARLLPVHRNELPGHPSHCLSPAHAARRHTLISITFRYKIQSLSLHPFTCACTPPSVLIKATPLCLILMLSRCRCGYMTACAASLFTRSRTAEHRGADAAACLGSLTVGTQRPTASPCPSRPAWPYWPCKVGQLIQPS